MRRKSSLLCVQAHSLGITISEMSVLKYAAYKVTYRTFNKATILLFQFELLVQEERLLRRLSWSRPPFRTICPRRPTYTYFLTLASLGNYATK